jgi:hypothetical protein
MPEAYECLWSDDGCTTNTGAKGNQIYWQFEGRVEADGTLAGTETFWWFFATDGIEEDCVDKLEVTGKRRVTDPDLLGCSTCEEVYDVQKVESPENDLTCRGGYNLFFDQDRSTFSHTILVDTKITDGSPNENGKTLVLHLKKDPRSGQYAIEEYARGNLVPDGAEHGPPGAYTWLGSKCQSR